MHQNAFGGRVPPGPAGGAHSARSDPLAVFVEGTRSRKGNGEGKGKGEDGRGREKLGGERNRKEGERRGGEVGREGSVPLQFSQVPPLSNSWRRPWFSVGFNQEGK